MNGRGQSVDCVSPSNGRGEAESAPGAPGAPSASGNLAQTQSAPRPIRPLRALVGPRRGAEVAWRTGPWSQVVDSFPVSHERQGERRGSIAVWGSTPLHWAILTALVAMALSLIWIGLGSSPLNDRAEGRYAEVGMTMSQDGGWLTPLYRGQVHLTKPPMTYWLIACSVRWLGETEIAARLPSAVAGSLTFLALLAFMGATRGWRQAVLAGGILAVMPMFMLVSRLALTDGILNLFWFGTLAAGAMAVRRPGQWRWPAILWSCAALALLTKGPLGWVPVGVLLAWLALGRRWGEARALRLWPGFILSVLPLAVWALMMQREHGFATGVWWRETAGRVAGEAAPHARPFWYFIPVFLMGLFPATLILLLPGLNFSWRRAWSSLRRGSESWLWVLALVIPFLLYSCIRGKLPAYLMPLCAPLAILTAPVLARCLDGARPLRGLKWPRVAECSGIAAIVIGAACILFVTIPVSWLTALARPALFPDALFGDAPGPHAIEIVHAGCAWFFPAGVFLMGAGAWLIRAWSQPPPRQEKANLRSTAVIASGLAGPWLRRRRSALAALWLALGGLLFAAFHCESTLLMPRGTPTFLAAMHHILGNTPAQLVTYEIHDSTVNYYSDKQISAADTPAELRRWAADHPGDLVVVTQADCWQSLGAKDPAVTEAFDALLNWDVEVWAEKSPWQVLRLTRPVANLPAARLEPQANAAGR